MTWKKMGLFHKDSVMAVENMQIGCRLCEFGFS